MTVIYTNVTQRFNKILFRGYKDGKRIQSSDAKYTPVLYIPQDTESEFKSLFKKNLQLKEFENIKEAKEFVKSYKDVFQIHGNDKFQYDFIHRNFKGELAVTLAQLKVCIIDIETTVGTGKQNFPDVMDPEEEVTLITVKDLNNKEMITWGSRPTKVKKYVLCANESDLLNKFINYIVVTDPDIISGWNCIYFDVAYLGSRIKRILGETALKRLSPFNLVEAKLDTLMGREQLRYEIVGRSVLDLLDLYKKFRFINRASYKLDYIGEVELKMKKLENPADSFKEFYTDHWDTFVEYNQRDVELVEALEVKLGMIYLAVTLAYLTKVNYDDVFSPVKTWESYILSTLYEENVFCELKKITRSDYQIVGGYVKEPVPGMYDWTASWDAASLYPSILMGWNMSPETIVDMIPDINPNDLLSSGIIPMDPRYTLAANGSRYKKETQGVLPRLTSTVFDARKSAKNKMLKLKQEYEVTHDPALKAESDRYGVLQLALKVQANSLYGICCNEYFLFFDNRLAEGITTTGQFIIQDVGRGLNVFMNKMLKTEHDFSIKIS
jgi:DNA polymerase elongation subunit (family B)